MLVAALALCSSQAKPAPINVVTWNIWRGGNEAMDAKDPRIKAEKQNQVIRVLRDSKADVIAMVETYGSGPVIAHGLRYHLHPRGTNVSILSRWPVVKDISVYKEFNCVGALIERPDGRQFALYSVWIHYVDDIWTDPASRNGRSVADFLTKEGDSRKVEVKAILEGIREKMREHPRVPVLLAGDFNSNSHLDYSDVARDQHGGLSVPWPVTQLVAADGYHDSYRLLHPKINRIEDRTWSPRFPEQEQDRIDFIFWKGDALRPRQSKMIDRAKGQWPSDHAAVQTIFDWTATQAPWTEFGGWPHKSFSLR